MVLRRDFQWQYGTFASARISQGIIDTGTLFRSIGHLMDRRNLGTFEMTEFEANKKYGFKSLSGSLDSQTTYTFEQAGQFLLQKLFEESPILDWQSEGILS